MNIELQSMAIDLPPFAAHPNRAPFHGVLTLVDTPSDRAPAGAKGHRVLLTRAAAEQALPSLLGMALDYAPSLDRHDARRKVGIITEANIVDCGVPVKPGADRVAQAFRPANSRGTASEPALAAEGHSFLKLATTSGAKALANLAAVTAGLKPCSTQLEATSHWPLTTSHSHSAIEIAGYLYARDFPEVMRELRRPHALGMSYEITDARIDDVRAAIWTVSQCTFTGAAILRRDKAAYRDTWIELI
jgi:hypothetical protein